MQNNLHIEKVSDTPEIGGVLVIKTYEAGYYTREPDPNDENDQGEYVMGKLISESAPMHNKVVSSDGYGRNIIIRQLTGDTTYSMAIDSARIGDGSVAPADSDTNLGNVLVSGISITNFSIANNVLTVDVFVSDGLLPNDTYSEFGLFCNSRLMSRVLISPAYTKTSGQDTLFTYTLTLTG